MSLPKMVRLAVSGEPCHRQRIAFGVGQPVRSKSGAVMVRAAGRSSLGSKQQLDGLSSAQSNLDSPGLPAFLTRSGRFFLTKEP